MKVKKNNGSNLVAGWLVVQFQGLVLRVVLQKVVCWLLTYCICKNFSESEAQLSEEIKKFWNLDSVGIRDDEVSVYEKHTSKIEFKKGQYEVGLPLKENFPAVEGNSDKCCNRLWKLKERLDKKPEYLKPGSVEQGSSWSCWWGA